jgi:hypothetical protein
VTPALVGAIASVGLAVGALTIQSSGGDPDALYARREDSASVARAADLWASRPAPDFEAAWKLARACYWMGTHEPVAGQKRALERGVAAGERAVRLARGRPEGHFWLAATMGRLADAFGIVPAVRYRGRIRDELVEVLRIDPAWEGGLADAALGQWYATVPRLFGGSRDTAKQHLRRALERDAYNTSALAFLGEMLAGEGQTAEARALLLRVLDAPVDEEWAPEDRELKRRAAEMLKTLR